VPGHWDSPQASSRSHSCETPLKCASPSSPPHTVRRRAATKRGLGAEGGGGWTVQLSSTVILDGLADVPAVLSLLLLDHADTHHLANPVSQEAPSHNQLPQ